MTGVKGRSRRRPADHPFADASRVATKRLIEGEPEGRIVLHAIANRVVDMASPVTFMPLRRSPIGSNGKPQKAVALQGEPDAPLLIRVQTFRDGADDRGPTTVIAGLSW